jgi:hypothetical protein
LEWHLPTDRHLRTNGGVKVVCVTTLVCRDEALAWLKLQPLNGEMLFSKTVESKSSFAEGDSVNSWLM